MGSSERILRKVANNQISYLKKLYKCVFQVEPYKTGAVAPEVGKRVVGKLPKERIPVVKKEETRVNPLLNIPF